jgi:hypothetical protein
MNVHVPVESMLGNPLSIRGLMRVGVYELKVAALAQSIGVGCFVSAAVIYGLIALPTPEAHRSATPPMDYQLTPTPATVPPGGGDKPAARVKGDAETFNQIVATTKAEMRLAQSPHESTIPQVEFVDVTSASERVLSLSEARAMPPREILGRTIDLRPMVTVTFDEDSVGNVPDAARKIIETMKSMPVDPFAAVVKFVPRAAGSRALSFGLIKTDSRVLFVDEDSKISEVFTSQEIIPGDTGKH